MPVGFPGICRVAKVCSSRISIIPKARVGVRPVGLDTDLYPKTQTRAMGPWFEASTGCGDCGTGARRLGSQRLVPGRRAGPCHENTNWRSHVSMMPEPDGSAAEFRATNGGDSPRSMVRGQY